MDKQAKRIAQSMESGIKPEVKLTKEHKAMLEAIAEVWQTNSSLARKLEQNFIAICNGETHDD